MSFPKLLALSTVVLMGILQLGTATAKDLLDDSRATFMKAYNSQNYDQLCNLLDKDASFRGKIMPDKWTHTADQIITERWKSKYTCSEIAQGAKTERQDIRIFTVGESNITLTPSRPATVLLDNNYALDTGKMLMAPKPGGTSKSISGSYVILWKREGNTWKMMHIDMNADAGARKE
jgi:hypothetical protein